MNSNGQGRKMIGGGGEDIDQMMLGEKSHMEFSCELSLGAAVAGFV
jgi:hypothetical protein